MDGNQFGQNVEIGHDPRFRYFKELCPSVLTMDDGCAIWLESTNRPSSPIKIFLLFFSIISPWMMANLARMSKLAKIPDLDISDNLAHHSPMDDGQFGQNVQIGHDPRFVHFSQFGPSFANG
jgi:hypothetical protein